MLIIYLCVLADKGKIHYTQCISNYTEYFFIHLFQYLLTYEYNCIQRGNLQRRLSNKGTWYYSIPLPQMCQTTLDSRAGIRDTRSTRYQVVLGSGPGVYQVVPRSCCVTSARWIFKILHKENPSIITPGRMYLAFFGHVHQSRLFLATCRIVILTPVVSCLLQYGSCSSLQPYVYNNISPIPFWVTCSNPYASTYISRCCKALLTITKMLPGRKQGFNSRANTSNVAL